MSNAPPPLRNGEIRARLSEVARQEQFLEVVPADEALRRWRGTVPHRPLPAETVRLAQAHGRVLAGPVAAPADAPPFDRSNVDGFALRSADLVGASDHAPRLLALNAEIIACGVAPSQAVQPGTATPIATGGVIPRGADAVVMVEHTDVAEGDGPATIEVRRAASPGQFITYAGSDIARGETLLRAGTRLSAREIGMLAACGVAEAGVVRRPRVGVLSTGDELTAQGEPLAPGRIYDANGPVVAAAVAENGGEALALGAFPDDEAKLGAAIREAVATCDLVVLSGGTSKGAGDVSHRILAGLPGARIIVHGVALKPGKPLCLALVGDTPVVVLPGFPTSAMFTFHTFVAPLIRAMAGLPEGEGRKVVAVMPQRMPSELGRTEFAFVSLVEGEDGLVAYPTAKGSGAVTAFAQADGFVEVEAERDALNAGERRIVTLIGAETRPPDLTITGSHCLGLDRLVDVLAEEGLTCRLIVVGSTAGLNAARRGECDLAGIHLLDPTSGLYNTPFLGAGLSLLPGWRRRQGIVFRPGDPRFASAADAASAVAAALADPACVMVSRNAGSGTRVLIDGLIAGARPPGFSNQPRSHNAVAVAVAQGRADWGVAIESVARLYGLGFLPLTDEHYDFALPVSRAGSRAVACLAAALDTPAFAAALAELGFSRAPEP